MYSVIPALAVLAITMAVPAAAEDSASYWYGTEYQACARKSTVAIVTCVDERTAAWEMRLAAAYQNLMRSIETRRQRARLAKAQKLWREFRDANCNYYRARPGSISQIEAAECMRATTEARARELLQAAKP